MLHTIFSALLCIGWISPVSSLAMFNAVIKPLACLMQFGDGPEAVRDPMQTDLPDGHTEVPNSVMSQCVAAGPHCTGNWRQVQQVQSQVLLPTCRCGRGRQSRQTGRA